jgi:hypothetical protein
MLKMRCTAYSQTEGARSAWNWGWMVKEYARLRQVCRMQRLRD